MYKAELMKHLKIKTWIYWLTSINIKGKNAQEHNPRLTQFPDRPYKILVRGGPASRTTNALHILKNCLYTKDPCECKSQFLINKRKDVGLKDFKNPKTFTEYSNDIKDVYMSIED